MSCMICDRINQIKKGENSHFVAELETGYIVLGDFQFFKGYALFLCKEHEGELHDLPSEFKERYLIEMSYVAQAVHEVFSPKKLNYECLGNAEPHLHWHIFPRYEDDPSPGTASWKVDKELRYNEKFLLCNFDAEQMKEDICNAISHIPGVVIHSKWNGE